jgi:hypothetical protein
LSILESNPSQELLAFSHRLGRLTFTIHPGDSNAAATPLVLALSAI